MSPAARSLQIWSVYVVLIGAVLLLFPNTLLGLFQIEETGEVWIRVLGVVVLALPFFYLAAAREESPPIFRATVFGRGLVAIGLTILAFTAGPWQLVLFGAVDAAGAMWTFTANRSGADQPVAAT